MSEPTKNVTLSREDLQALLEAVVKAAKAPNALEQKAIDAEVERDRRRTMLMIELAKIEEQKQIARKNGCSHERYPQGHRHAGHPAPRGIGEFTTGGQLTGRELATLVCLRCSILAVEADARGTRAD